MKHIVCIIEKSEDIHPVMRVQQSDMETLKEGEEMTHGEMIFALQHGFRVVVNPQKEITDMLPIAEQIAENHLENRPLLHLHTR